MDFINKNKTIGGFMSKFNQLISLLEKQIGELPNARISSNLKTFDRGERIEGVKELESKYNIKFIREDSLPFEDRRDVSPFSGNISAIKELSNYISKDKKNYQHSNKTSTGRKYQWRDKTELMTDERADLLQTALYSVAKLFGFYHFYTYGNFMQVMNRFEEKQPDAYLNCIQLFKDELKSAGISIPPNRVPALFHEIVRSVCKSISKDLSLNKLDAPRMLQFLVKNLEG